jgi:hypothetical protein
MRERESPFARTAEHPVWKPTSRRFQLTTVLRVCIASNTPHQMIPRLTHPQMPDRKSQMLSQKALGDLFIFLMTFRDTHHPGRSVQSSEQSERSMSSNTKASPQLVPHPVTYSPQQGTTAQPRFSGPQSTACRPAARSEQLVRTSHRD